MTAVYCGLGHQAAVNTAGDLFVWGRNRQGCLGLGSDRDQHFPLQVAQRKRSIIKLPGNCAVITSLRISQWKFLQYLDLMCVQVLLGGRVKSVSLGVDHSVALATPWINK